jgi:hypothetical protein
LTIPPGISHQEVLDHSYAVDGDNAFTECPRRELQQREHDLIAWLAEHGHTVKFS